MAQCFETVQGHLKSLIILVSTLIM